MNEPRRPREDIPKDNICPEPYCGAGPFKNQSGFIGHMAAKHRIKYEKVVRDQAMAWYDRVDPNKPPKFQTWHRFALAKHAMYGQSYEKIAKELGKSTESLRKIAQTEEGKKYIAQLEDQASDPAQMIRNLMSSDVLNKYLDWQLAFEWAKEQRDYDAVHKMVKEIGLKDIIGDELAQQAQQITINLAGTDLAAGGGSTSHEIILDAEFEDESENP